MLNDIQMLYNSHTADALQYLSEQFNTTHATLFKLLTF